MKSTANHGRTGFSLVELAIAMTVTVMLGGMLILALESSMKAFRTGTTATEVEATLSRAIDDIAERLKGSATGMVDPIPPAGFFTTQLDFQSVTGYLNDAPVWGAPERLLLELSPGELDDGIDNDQNGLVDECRVVWVENPDTANERRTVICNWVSETLEGETPGNNADENGNGLEDEPGLCFDFDGNRVTIRLTIERLSPEGYSIMRTNERTISFRNATDA